MSLNMDELKAKLSHLDFGKVMGFVKGHWVLWVSCLVIVGAPLGSVFLQAWLREPLDAEIQARVKLFDQLGAVERATFELRAPGGAKTSETAEVTPALIEVVRAHHASLAKLADDAYAKALDRNRSNRAVLAGLEQFIPAPANADGRRVNLLKEQALPLIVAEQERLLTHALAMKPAANEEILDRVNRAEDEYIKSVLLKENRETVTDPTERAQLQSHLVLARLEAILDHAHEGEFYVDAGGIAWKPVVATGDSPEDFDKSLASIFRAQWDLWVVDDILKAISNLNGKASTGVISAPIKRVMQLSIDSIPGIEVTETAAAASSDAAATAPSGGQPVDPKAPVIADFKTSLNGLITNSLFDVRYAHLTVVVETESLLKLVDALARQNFMTITNLSMKPADTFAAMRAGFAYGPKPCSEVTLAIQTVWFRDWTTEKMPASMLQAINAVAKTPPEAATDAQPPTTDSTGGAG